jgi:putative hydrolase
VITASGVVESGYQDVNAVIGGYLRDLAFVQGSRAQMFGYKRAAQAVLATSVSLAAYAPDAELPRIPGVGPASQRVVREVLATGGSPSVERAIEHSGQRADIEQRRAWRRHALSRAEVLRINGDARFDAGPRPEQYLGDCQMHSEWSDGQPTVAEIADACVARGYQFAAVTDHSYGLRIAGGMSMAEASDQRRAIDALNHGAAGFRLLQGIEANIGMDGQLDLTPEEAGQFDLVLAAPHSRLRRSEDQTDRMLTALSQPAVRILAHPRGRILGSRGGIVADWDRVFAAAADRHIAVEIDGDPARQDLDYTVARRALAAGCLFALDSDAHTTGQLVYAETAIAHARLAGIPADRVINCWPLDRLQEWLQTPPRVSMCPNSSPGG